jgi:hypothetical protein
MDASSTDRLKPDLIHSDFALLRGLAAATFVAWFLSTELMVSSVDFFRLLTEGEPFDISNLLWWLEGGPVLAMMLVLGIPIAGAVSSESDCRSGRCA